MFGNLGRWFTGEADPNAPDFVATNDAQNASNRLNETTPFGTKTFGPNGVEVGLGGPLAGAGQAVAGQVAGALGSPVDFGGLPPMLSGDQARDQAITAAFDQSRSRLDPIFAKRREGLRTQLLNQGLDPGGEAYGGAMGDFNLQENDAYQGALNSAIMQGTAAGSAVFDQNARQHQQAMTELLLGRSLPLQELSALQGFVPGTGYNQNTGGLQALAAQTGWNQNQRDALMNMLTEIVQAGRDAGKDAASVIAMGAGG
jgi:hypothetical protein